MTLHAGDRLVLASHNPGKVREIALLLAPYNIDVVGAKDLGLPEPEENGSSFAENAIIKAAAAAKAANMLALADDSGLAVAALNGDPGIYSARWAGPNKDFRAAMTRIENLLKEKTSADYAAKFVCALALVRPGHEPLTYIGEVHGKLTFPPRGENGFGYDPIFIADGMDETFGEIAPEHKHAISHRARAFAKLSAAVLG